LSVEELLLTLNAAYDKEARYNKFMAALQGVDMEENNKDPEARDITKLTGSQAQQAGFGIGVGLGYVEE